MNSRTVYLGLGSNLGDRLINLKRAVSILSSKLNLTAVSGIYESKPHGDSEGPLFLNMAVAVETYLALPDLLILCKGIERAVGRLPDKPNAPRIIDIDILCAEGEIVKSPDLEVPHARLPNRAFVLAPLCELCPEYIHPDFGKSVEEMLGELPDCENAEFWGELNMVF